MDPSTQMCGALIYKLHNNSFNLQLNSQYLFTVIWLGLVHEDVSVHWFFTEDVPGKTL